MSAMAVFASLLRRLGYIKLSSADQTHSASAEAELNPADSGFWRSHDGRSLPLLDPDLTPLPVAPYGTPRIRLFEESELLEPTTERPTTERPITSDWLPLDSAEPEAPDPSIKLIMKKPAKRTRQHTLPMWRIPAPRQTDACSVPKPKHSAQASTSELAQRKERARKPVIESPMRRASSRHREREALARVIAMAKPRTRPGFAPRHQHPRPVTEH